ncbi:MAG: exodeoxyribonuclease III [Pseudomonadota bacterium]|nr:exodeoxyribonuclease III [Pseudomonadota bacterium]
MKIATWNVNSVKIRLVQLLEWLKRDKPDIVLLQETKCVNDAFPAMEIEELGYNLALHGEKTYNGVAILSRFPLEDVRRGLPGDDGDSQARYIEAVVSLPQQALRVASVYVPNGQSADSDKFQYKLRFLDRLCAHVATLLPYEEMLIIGGDYNIAPDDRDVHDPRLWQGSVLTHDEARQRLRRILYLGMYDAWRLCHPQERAYSWWDYRANAFERDDGLRIDHLLLSPQAADSAESCIIEKDMRTVEKASDHTPVVIQLSVASGQ